MSNAVGGDVNDNQGKTLERLIEQARSREESPRHSSPAVLYVKETTPEQRSTLAREICSAISTFIDDERAVYLEGFGILIPGSHTQQTPRVIEDRLLVRQETSRTVAFEKCNELVSYQRERYGKIVELHELTRRIYPRLPLVLQAYWSELETRRYIAGFMHFLKEEVVVRGISEMLSEIGIFYALHNRQGNSFQDWYAGADIFIKTQYQPLVKVGKSRLVERPVFQSPWEVFQAAFGLELQSFEVHLPEELQKLDPETAAESDLSTQQGQIAVAIFDTKQTTRQGERVLLYCTDGIRKLHGQDGHKRIAGCEFVVQIAVTDESSDFPVWPNRFLTLAWLLLESSKSKSIRPGTGLSLDVPLTDTPESPFRTIYTTRFAKLPSEQLCTDGPFYYLNITGIFEEEAEILRSSSADHLTALLEHRNADQIFREERASIATKSELTDQERPVFSA